MAEKSRNDRGGYNRRLNRGYAKVISINQVKAKKLKGKPRCPLCDTVLMHVYDDTPKGHTNQKCLKCGSNAQWRKEHPREAYKMSYRAIRIANKKQGYPPPSYRPVDTRPLKERLMHKYRLNEIRRQNTTKAWSNYSDEQRSEISRKISETQKANYESKPQEEINASCANARAHIDREKQGAAASKGIKRWWEELKADPVRYKEYMDRRSKSASIANKKYMASLTEAKFKRAENF